MRRLIKGVGIAAVVVLITLVVAFAWGRLRPPTQAQSEAMALLKPPPRPAGSHNAWVDFWLLDYDVPAAEREAAYARERRLVTAWTQQADRASPGYSSNLGRRYAALPKLSFQEHAQLCGITSEHCLTTVRQHASALTALMRRHSKRLARLRDIGSADVLWNDMPADPGTPFPPFNPSDSLLLTAAALDFVQGHPRPALAEVCRNVQTLRRLHAHTNSLLGAMVTATWSDPAERLFADMLVRLPPGEVAPAVCAESFAPVTLADIDLCAPMQRAFAGVAVTIEAATRQRPTGFERVAQFLTSDVSHRLRLMAPQYAWACRSNQQSAMLADRRMTRAQIAQGQPDFLDRLSNPVSTILARIAAPAYVDYANRNEDYAAGLRLGRALLQARADAASPDKLGGALTPQLDGLNQGGARVFSIDSGERFVRMPYYVPHAGRSALALSIAAPLETAQPSRSASR